MAPEKVLRPAPPSVASQMPLVVVEPSKLMMAEKSSASWAGPIWPNTTPPFTPAAALWTCISCTLSFGLAVWAGWLRIGPQSSPITVMLDAAVLAVLS